MRTMSPMERAMRLAAVTGLKATFGPALICAAQNRPEAKAMAIAAMGEMVVDKLPFVPSRSRLPLLLPRVLAGYWTAKQSLERDGIHDPSGAMAGAAVAAGVAIAAPLVRKTIRTLLGVPDVAIGAAEDYFALKCGSEAAGLSLDDVRRIGLEAVSEVREGAAPAIEEIRHRLQPSRV